MQKIALILMVLVLFFGCSSKDDTLLFKEAQKKSALFNNLGQTKEIRVLRDERIFGLVSLTYLYEKGKVDYDKNDNERFIVGIYHQEGDPQKWSLKLDNIAPKEITTLMLDSEYLSSIPIVNSWTKYYLVVFEHTKSKKINLLYEDGALGVHKVVFSKKFLYEESGKVY
ncbi:MAG: hypothetical protein JXQ68_06865 [Campylobacterales bacterium]|nr:hypothetical protein [Campylobacterales bacterium]